jgi:hypothetical protein
MRREVGLEHREHCREIDLATMKTVETSTDRRQHGLDLTTRIAAKVSEHEHEAHCAVIQLTVNRNDFRRVDDHVNRVRLVTGDTISID